MRAAGHTGGSLSEVEILVALYFHILRIDPQRPDWPERDRFILSKGHASPGYYCTLACRGLLPRREAGGVRRRRLDAPGTSLHVEDAGRRHVHRLAGTGALGGHRHGPRPRPLEMQFHVYVLLGDGELQEGQVWEAAMFAGQHRLTGLVAIVDYNRVQLSGTVPDTLDLEPLADKWRAFGWQVLECDGHDVAELVGDHRAGQAAQRLGAGGA